MRKPAIDYIKRISDNYASLGYKTYEWVSNKDTPPWAPMVKPLSECRLGLVASGGIYIKGQVAFHTKDDFSYRIIPKDVNTTDLRTAHFAYDQTDARRDPNVVFPIDTLKLLEKEGVIGELADRAFTFMGGIYSTRKVRDELAPAITRQLKAEHVDLALLVPV